MLNPLNYLQFIKKSLLWTSIFLLISSTTRTYPVKAQANNLTQVEAKNLQAELENLINRIESTLVAAKANNPSKNQSSSQYSISQAKEKLSEFKELIKNRNYRDARETWLQARRLLWDNYPTDIQYEQSEVRAIWLDRGTLVDAKTPQELTSIFDRLAKSGINTVFIEALNSSYPIYPSQIAPQQNPLTRDWDRLQLAVQLAHERKMEIHAWVWIFAAANRAHNKILHLNENYLGPVLSLHPDWINKSNSGANFDQGKEYRKAFFDPGNPQAREYILSILDEIVSKYDVDGIQLDYIRYPFQSKNTFFGYGNSSRSLFKQQTGVDPITLTPKSSLWNQWLNFRVHLIDSFVKTASERLKQKKRNLIISAAVFPYSRQERLKVIQQDWEEWGKNNWVDLFAVMTYAMDTNSLEGKTLPLLEKSSAGSALIVPGLRISKIPDPVMVDQVQLMRNMPTLGYALFATEGFNSNSNLQDMLSRTQGSILENKTEPIPYRQPFQSAKWRYQSLRKEWDLVLSQDNIDINSEGLIQWKKKSEQVSALLQAMTQNPTIDEARAVKYILSDLNKKLPTWLQGQTTISKSQIDIWCSRLASINSLVGFGQKDFVPVNQTQLGSN